MTPKWRYEEAYRWGRLIGDRLQVIRRDGNVWRYSLYDQPPDDAWSTLEVNIYRTLAEARAWADRDPAVAQEDGR